MPDPDQKSNSSPDKKALEDWLQLPDDFKNEGEPVEVEKEEIPLQSLDDFDADPIPVDLITGEPLKKREIIENTDHEDETEESLILDSGVDGTDDELDDVDINEIEVDFNIDETGEETVEVEVEEKVEEGTEENAGVVTGEVEEMVLFSSDETDLEAEADLFEDYSSDVVDLKDDNVIIEEEVEVDEVERLGKMLAKEFGDTLTGGNAATLPIGLVLIALSFLVWFHEPVSAFFGVPGLVDIKPVIIGIISVALALAGIHLIFYYGVHRVSNIVKSKELDRLIEKRRVHNPCRHLNCREPEEMLLSEDGSVFEEVDMIWQCDWFGIDLPESSLCVICDLYDPIAYPESDLDIENQNFTLI